MNTIKSNKLKQLDILESAFIDQEASLRNMMEKMLQQRLESQMEEYLDAKRHERTDNRRGYRNGYYERQLVTRVGTVTLAVCRDRDGEFSTDIFQRYQRSEQALITAMLEMYIQGVSTRKVKKVVEELAGKSVSKSLVSKLIQQLNPEIEDWRNRQLTESYPYLLMDARYEKVRVNGSVVSKAFVVIVGILENGMREIIGTYVLNSESYEEWSECIMHLKQRNLKGVEFVACDNNIGLNQALAKHFQGVTIQRCQVHYMRNLTTKLAKKDRTEACALLKDVFAARTKEDALGRSQNLKSFLVSIKREKLVDWIDETIEETLQVYSLPEQHHKQMRSTNMLERFNQELKRRSRIIRIFPNENSCLLILSTLSKEQSEEWITGKRYLKEAV